MRLDVRWPAATPNGSPIHRYSLQRSLDGGPWSDVPLPSRLARAKSVAVRPWQVVAFRLQATAASSQASEWAVSESVWLTAPQERDDTVELSANWQSVRDKGSFGGKRSATRTPGASATFEFVGQEVGWVAVRGPRKGLADVYVDGQLAKTVDLRRRSTAKRRVVFRATWATAGRHTLRIVARGGAQNATIDLDALVMLGRPTTETLVGAGDIAECPVDSEGNLDPTRSGAYETARLVEGVEGVVFTAGDNSQTNGSAKQFADCYDPTWGVLKERTRPTPGNHDYATRGAAGYYDYFGDSAGPDRRGWYRYDVGTWRIYALNSECRAATTCPQQLAWLEAELAAEPHKCTLAIWHRPRWGPTAKTDWLRVDALWRVLAAAGTELVINGHNHMYSRWVPADETGAPDPTGMRVLIVGTGGGALYPYPSVHPLTEVHDYSTHGVVRLDLAPGGYSWEFLPTQADGFTDSGTDTCR